MITAILGRSLSFLGSAAKYAAKLGLGPLSAVAGVSGLLLGPVFSNLRALITVAFVIGGLSAVGFVYVKGYYEGKAQVERAVLLQAVAAQKDEAAKSAAAAAADEEALAKQQDMINSLQKAIEETKNALANKNSVCIDPDTARRLRKL